MINYLPNKIGIGIISSERNGVSLPLFVLPLFKLIRKLNNCEIIYSQVGNQAVARNMVLSEARRTNIDALLFVDSDMVIPTDTVERLLKTMYDFNAQIGTGLYFNTMSPYSPIAHEENYEPIKDISKPRLIGGAGMGVTLLLKDVFDIEFDTSLNKGEDIIFCERARAKGHKIVFDPSVKAQHIRMVGIDEAFIKKNYGNTPT